MCDGKEADRRELEERATENLELQLNLLKRESFLHGKHDQTERAESAGAWGSPYLPSLLPFKSIKLKFLPCRSSLLEQGNARQSVRR